MSQNDLAIADQTFPSMLADLNSAFQALASMSSGDTEPPTTYAFQLWADSTTDLMKLRNAANNAWLTLAKLDTGSNRWEPRSDIVQALTAAGVTLKNAAGVAIASFSDAGTLSGASITIGLGKTLNVAAGGLTLADDQIDGVKVKAATEALRGSVELASSVEAAAGTDDTRAMTPLKTKAAIEALQSGLGAGQTWQNMAGSRTHSTTYQNTTGKPIGVFISIDGSSGRNVQVSTNNSTWIILNDMPSGKFDISFIVPAGHYYRTQGGPTTIAKWSELRT